MFRRTLLTTGRLTCRRPCLESVRTLGSAERGLPTRQIQDIVKNFTEWGFPQFWSGGRCPTPKVTTQLVSSQSELAPRHMDDSYQDAVIPLASDAKLREKYVTSFNTVRFGRLLEDLDILAGLIAYNHNADPSRSPENLASMGIVTAAVDQINMMTPIIQPDKDVYVSGHVSWVGASSMEVTMDVKQEKNGNLCDVIEARFMMVARNAKTGGKAYVNPLQITTPEEAKLLAAGDARKKRREICARKSLLRTPPTETERLLVHELFLQTLDDTAVTFKHPVKPEGSVWMDDTLLKNVIICFPEKRNIHNKIFGGYLMRKGFELGWATASVFSQMQPAVYAVDDITFAKPVSIGELLYLSAQVIFTSGTFIQVRVHAEVVDPKTSKHETTNVFHFTFTTETPSRLAIPKTYAASRPFKVVPCTYAEFMMYLDGKRRHAVMTSKT